MSCTGKFFTLAQPQQPAFHQAPALGRLIRQLGQGRLIFLPQAGVLQAILQSLRELAGVLAHHRLVPTGQLGQ